MASTPRNENELTFRRAAVLTGRALRLRCPHCGRGKAFHSWLQMRRRCPACGLLLERGEEDYFIGAYVLNLVIAELIAVAGMLVLILATWPKVPWSAITWVLMVLTIPCVILTYPLSRTLWLAADLLFRAPEASDFRPDADVVPLPRDRAS